MRKIKFLEILFLYALSLRARVLTLSFFFPSQTKMKIGNHDLFLLKNFIYTTGLSSVPSPVVLLIYKNCKTVS